MKTPEEFLQSRGYDTVCGRYDDEIDSLAARDDAWAAKCAALEAKLARAVDREIALEAEAESSRQVTFDIAAERADLEADKAELIADYDGLGAMYVALEGKLARAVELLTFVRDQPGVDPVLTETWDAIYAFLKPDIAKGADNGE